MKKVFLDNLPKKNKGNSSSIDWKNTIGYKVKFIYNDIEDEVEIINYKIINHIGFIDLKYNNNKFTINRSGFLKCSLGELLGCFSKKYLFKIGDIIKDDRRHIEILDLIRIKHNSSTQKAYKYKCLKDGYIGKIDETALKIGQGCPVCINKKIIKDINDISTTNPELIPYFVDINDTYKYSNVSGKSVNIKCPECGYIKNRSISSLYNQGFSCPKCGDGISYPEKFVLNLLEQLSVNFKTQLTKTTFKWCEKFKYDFYIGYFNCILETHGLQHYEESTGNWKNLLLEIQENDNIKKNLALNNGIKKYIVINCKYSKLDWIKNNIMQSELPQLLNFKEEDINWLECHGYACKSLVKIVCDLWDNKNIKNIFEISKLINIGDQTIRKYLKQGVSLGWCDYNPKEALIKNGKILSQSNNKSIVQLSLVGEYISEFNSAIEAEKELKIKGINKHIGSCCKKKRNKTGGFKWMYKEDWDVLNKSY